MNKWETPPKKKHKKKTIFVFLLLWQLTPNGKLNTPDIMYKQSKLQLVQANSTNH